MFGIALYNTLRKIPDVSEAEAKEAVTEVANSKEVATKADIEALKTAMAEQETRLVRQMYVVAGIVIAGISVIVAVFGLIIKFL